LAAEQWHGHLVRIFTSERLQEDPQMKDRYAFRKTKLYQQGSEYLDELYHLTENLNSKTPESLKSQIIQAATHIIVNVASKSSGKTTIEQSFLVDGCLMSLFETVACLDIVERLKLAQANDLKKARDKGDVLLATLETMKKTLNRH
jgi:four helix bundle protein